MKDIRNWYELGNRKKGNKMRGAQIQSVFEPKYPDRYNIPTEYYITNAINSLNQ